MKIATDVTAHTIGIQHRDEPARSKISGGKLNVFDRARSLPPELARMTSFTRTL